MKKGLLFICCLILLLSLLPAVSAADTANLSEVPPPAVVEKIRQTCPFIPKDCNVECQNLPKDDPGARPQLELCASTCYYGNRAKETEFFDCLGQQEGGSETSIALNSYRWPINSQCSRQQDPTCGDVCNTRFPVVSSGSIQCHHDCFIKRWTWDNEWNYCEDQAINQAWDALVNDVKARKQQPEAVQPPSGVTSAPPEAESSGILAKVQKGEAWLFRQGKQYPLTGQVPLAVGDIVRTGNGNVLLYMPDDSQVKLAPKSEFRVEAAVSPEFPGLFELLKGTFHYKRLKCVFFEHPALCRTRIHTTAVTYSVLGTEFIVSHDETIGTTTIHLSEGVLDLTVTATNETKELAAGQTITINKEGITETKPLSNEEWQSLVAGLEAQIKKVTWKQTLLALGMIALLIYTVITVVLYFRKKRLHKK